MGLFDSLLNKVERLLGGNAPGFKIDEDTYIAVAGRDSYMVIEGGRTVEVNAELGSDPERTIYASSVIAWEPPHSDYALGKDDRDRLIGKLGVYFTRQGTTYKVI